MASQSQTPVKGAHLRSRTSSVSATMAPPTSTTPNHRRLSSTLVKPVATPPKTAPRSAKRSSLMLSATERRSLSTTLDKMAESEPQFVSHLTDALLTRLTGCSNLSEAKSLRVSESDAKVRVRALSIESGGHKSRETHPPLPKMPGLSFLSTLSASAATFSFPILSSNLFFSRRITYHFCCFSLLIAVYR